MIRVVSYALSGESPFEIMIKSYSGGKFLQVLNQLLS
jgi:hypothetical protein